MKKICLLTWKSNEDEYKLIKETYKTKTSFDYIIRRDISTRKKGRWQNVSIDFNITKQFAEQVITCIGLEAFRKTVIKELMKTNLKTLGEE